jgi:DNA-binding PadR family transcriptional regulator
MPKRSALGEFEQRILLSIVRLGVEAHAVRIARTLEDLGRRSVARGALYTTLDRLENKGFVRWSVDTETPERDGLPRRLFKVTAAGMKALHSSREALREQLQGLNEVLGES